MQSGHKAKIRCINHSVRRLKSQDANGGGHGEVFFFNLPLFQFFEASVLHVEMWVNINIIMWI